MEIKELLAPARVACDAQVTSKKKALEVVSGLLSGNGAGLTEAEIFDSLIGRERLGSTGLGHGVAIPHARLPGHEEALAAFVKLENGVDYDAVDRQPVDLLFSLLVPEHFTDEHLEILAKLARMFSDEAFCRKIRESDDAEKIYTLLIQKSQE